MLLLSFFFCVELKFASGWISNVGDNITRCFSADETDPPELELDPVLQEAAALVAVAVRGGGNGSNNNSNIGDDGHDNDYCTKNNAAASPSSEAWFVFDPVFGVVPSECRDKWAQQGREMAARREASKTKAKTSIPPPVRYSQPPAPKTSHSPSPSPSTIRRKVVNTGGTKPH